MIFTAKHHDGFCQWNTKTTDFSSETILGGEDVMESLQKGCEDNEMGLGYIFLHGICIKGEKGLGQSQSIINIFSPAAGAIDQLWPGR